MTTRHLLWSVLVCCVVVGAAQAAELSPNFEWQLNQARTNEFVSGIVILESPMDIRALDLMLHARKAGRAERYRAVYNALQENARQTQPKFETELKDAELLGLVRGYTAYWIENLFVVSAKPEFFLSLRDRGDIQALSENFKAELIEPIRGADVQEYADELTRPPRNPLDEQTTPGQNAIGATRVNRELGITGHGVLVANLDTGVDGNHPALASRWRGLTAPVSASWLDVLGTAPTFPEDDNAHGTHVMGTICGREITAGGDTNTVGSAPDAEWIACNAINQGVGNDFTNDVLNAYQWFANPDGDSTTLNDVPDVVQNSWGVNANFPGYSTCYDFWNTALVNLEAVGCVVTFSAGNEGPAASSLRSPAIHALSEVQMFSVGAVDATSGDAPPWPIASFSSRGPSPCNGTHIKPEISAPGVNVYSSVPGGGYNGTYSGTSMAGPHVAGIVALMREACPDCDPITIKEALLNTAIDSGYGATGNDNTYGYGFIDGYSAVLAVFNLGLLSGVVTENGSALANVTVTITENGRSTVSDAAGAYDIGLSAGTYSMVFSKFGYTSVTVDNITIAEGDTTVLNVAMTLAPSADVSGHVYDADGNALGGATVAVLNAPVAPVLTDAAGAYLLTLPVGSQYNLRATGLRGAAGASFVLTADTVVDFYMPQDLYCFDFEAGDQGWTVGAADDNATSGFWGRMDPEQTTNNGIIVQPGDDHTATGVNCFVTNGVAGSSAGANDVDGGKTTLLSPVWDLSAETGVAFELFCWFSNDLGNNPGEDYLDIDVSDDGGSSWVNMFHERTDFEEWRRLIFVLDDYVAPTSQVRLRVIAQDQAPGSLLEAAVDDVCVMSSGMLPPTQLTALVVDGGVQLNWLPAAGATSYTVWRSLEFPPTPLNATIVGTTDEPVFLDVNALDSVGFYFVTATR